MTFKRVEGTKAIIRASAVSEKQFAYVQEIIAANNGEPKIVHKTLRAICNTLTGSVYAPYWITNNLVTKMKERGMYDLSRLHVSTAKPKSAPAKSAKKESKPKRERKTAKLGAPASVPVAEAPALSADVPLGIEAPAAE
jgi:hypothetical protein